MSNKIKYLLFAIAFFCITFTCNYTLDHNDTNLDKIAISFSFVVSLLMGALFLAMLKHEIKNDVLGRNKKDHEKEV